MHGRLPRQRPDEPPEPLPLPTGKRFRSTRKSKGGDRNVGEKAVREKRIWARPRQKGNRSGETQLLNCGRSSMKTGAVFTVPLKAMNSLKELWRSLSSSHLMICCIRRKSESASRSSAALIELPITKINLLNQPQGFTPTEENSGRLRVNKWLRPSRMRTSSHQ